MNKRFYSKKMYIRAAIFIVCVICSILAAGILIRTHIYRECYISFESLIDDAKSIKAFEARDGIITALDDDPWIEYENHITRVQTVNVDVSYLSPDYTYSELFVMHADGEMERYKLVLNEGVNVIDLQLNRENIGVLRFDLLTGKGQQIGINGITINQTDALRAALVSDYNYLIIFVLVCVISITLLLFCLWGTYIAVEYGKGKRVRVGFFVLMLLVFTVFYSGCNLVALKTIFKEKTVTFNELTSYSNSLNDFDEVDHDLDQAVISTSIDPWITYYNNDANAVRTITFNISSLSQSKTDSELFIFFESGRFDVISFSIREGANTIELPQYLERIQYLRFDLTDKSSVRIGIDSLVLNAKQNMTKIIWLEMLNKYIKLVLSIIFISTVILGTALGSRCRKKDKTGTKIKRLINLSAPIVIMVLIFGSAFLSLAAALVVVFMGAWFIGRYSVLTQENEKKEHSKFYAWVMLLLMAIIYILLPEGEFKNIFFVKSGGYMIRIMLSAVCALGISYTAALIFIKDEVKSSELDLKSKIGFKIGYMQLNSMLLEALSVFVMTVLVEFTAKFYFVGTNVYDISLELLHSNSFWLSLVLLGAAYCTVRLALGGAAGRFAAVVLYIVYYLGNFIKLKYHDSILMPTDVLQLNDFLSVVDNYIPVGLLAAIIVLCVALFWAAIYKFGKKITKFKPRLFMAVTMAAFVICLSECIEKNYFLDIGLDVTEAWRGTKDCVKNDGVVAYSYIKFREIMEISPKPSENYTKAYMQQLDTEFNSLDKADAANIKPDVILVMEESMFDVSKVPDVECNLPITENINSYRSADTVSPKFGGGTGSVEFEALTGMSNYFFPENVVPYVTYWNNDKNTIPGLAEEFNKNGYKTMAIHPNDGKVYNRDTVYKCMGFDSFDDLEDMSVNEAKLTDDGYVTDDVLADYLIDKANQNSTESKFIFAITIENHTLYESKYKETEVKLSSDKLSDSELHNLEQYSQGVYNADKFIAKMVDYVDNAKRPTLLYIWGDHLPALSAFGSLGYIDDKYNKYTTPLIAYSNYKTIDIGQEYITPNQLAPQILRDAQVKYSPYFDFIYSLRQKYPVIQKEFDIPPEDEEIVKYGDIQYDLLFGKKYLLGYD